MRTWPTLAVMCLVVVCRASPPTYDEAVKLSEGVAHNAKAKGWVDTVFAPFSKQHLEVALHTCVEMLSEGATQARFVIDLQPAPQSVVVHDDAPTPFSDCLKGKLQELKWPMAHEGIRYLPLVINAHRPKDGAQSADDVIISVTPSNKSLERTLLTREQYLATFAGKNSSIDVTNYDANEVWAYVQAVAEDDYAGYSICWGYIPFVYRTSDGAYDHIYASTRTENAFLIVLKDNRSGEIYGHHLLDLNIEYGMESPKQLSRNCERRPDKSLERTRER
jgi:hypothetical protein